jgi:Asp-tRNA(Asn)/Glu-tRNA(Gln) amidotransferase A subunit family amidase
MNKKELWKWGAVKIAKAVINKKITAEEVIISNIKRRKAINPLLNAVVIEMDQQALKKAKNLDEKIKNALIQNGKNHISNYLINHGNSSEYFAKIINSL